MTAPLRIIALADSDSYVKWGAALVGGLDDAWDAEVMVVDTPKAVSDAQLDAALVGSGIPDDRVTRVAYPRLIDHLAAARPDAVLLAVRGPLVRVLARDVLELDPQPVIVCGIPGIAFPSSRKALIYRAQTDLFVVHSRREREAYAERAARQGAGQRFALATLPFARAAEPGSRASGGSDLVFAVQATVPRDREDRLRVARTLVRAAEAHPERRVVVKLRAAAGEEQTHTELDDYVTLLDALSPLPANLVVSTVPMARALDTAEGLVTVSSTAAIEAVARGIPVIALDAFGVSRSLINLVHADAGLLGSDEDVVARRFRHPTPGWLSDNYFHDPAENDWAPVVADLIALRRAGRLEPRAPHARRGGTLRDAWERKSVLGEHDASAAGAVAYAVGVPARAVVRAGQRIRRALRRPDQQPGPEGSSAHVSSTSAVRASTTRTL